MTSVRPRAYLPIARRGIVALSVGAIALSLVGSATPATAATSIPSALSPAATPELAPVAVDGFGRTVAGGWGTATTGGAWTTVGGVATDYAVSGGSASMSVRQAGWNLYSGLAAVRSTDTEVQARVSLDKKPVGGAVDVDVVGRAVDTTQGYRLRSKLLADGSIRTSLIKVVGKTTTTLSTTTLTGLGFAGTAQLQVRLQVKGTPATTLQAKVWAVGTAEPAAWTLTAADSTAALQVPGGIGVNTYTASAITNAPIATRVSDVWAGPTSAARTLAAAPAVGTVQPGLGNTGVPNGTVLTRYNGDLTISTPGAVVEGLDIYGFVKVTAPNVTIKNSIIRGTATNVQRALLSSTSDTASVTIQDSELFAASPSGWIDGIRGWNFTATRVNIHHVIDAAHIYGNNVTIQGSWLHDNLHFEVDPAQNNTPSHDDSIQIQKGSGIKIVGNSISGAYNTGIQFTQDQGIVSNVTVDRNWADGGGCTVNLAEKGMGPFQGVAISNNTFGRNTKVANCAIIAPTTTVLSTSANFYTDGLVASVRKGS
ncbi:right-handed parallel beta-helix repeat-containing protein [Cellulomonas sp. Root485]|uniref:right-handed parallel beta-helix repeat-containing protein n=1 Tax=Cellulomonas sp. Root485 TaxID=1736546 RepID=UPI000A726884|nr:right-handed parallel beta-helix repeat-containing protein [Cellulomonas sp. Root485]